MGRQGGREWWRGKGGRGRLRGTWPFGLKSSVLNWWWRCSLQLVSRSMECGVWFRLARWCCNFHHRELIKTVTTEIFLRIKCFFELTSPVMEINPLRCNVYTITDIVLSRFRRLSPCAGVEKERQKSRIEGLRSRLLLWTSSPQWMRDSSENGFQLALRRRGNSSFSPQSSSRRGPWYSTQASLVTGETRSICARSLQFQCRRSRSRLLLLRGHSHDQRDGDIAEGQFFF